MMRLPAFWSAPYHPARLLLLQRGTYLLLALDAWLLMIEHGGRYGAGDFNVAHFALLDVLLPLPTPAAYVALVMGCGLLSLGLALFEGARWLKVLLGVAYTLAWAMSMHDSYQHHYFLSWVLLFLAFAPAVTAELGVDAAARVRGAALHLVACACATMYLFTAISKLSADWRSGLVLRTLAAGKVHSPFAWLPRLFTALGARDEQAWSAAAAALVAMQLLIACGYVSSVGRDGAAGRARALLCGGALVLALAFHGVTELEGSFGIGWFSYYMLLLALALLAPARWLSALWRSLYALAKPVDRVMREHPPSLLLALSGAGLLSLFTAQRADLPGARLCCGLFFLLLAARALPQWLRGDLDHGLRSTLFIALPMLTLVAVLEFSSVRFDYYRLAAGESQRMGQLEQALALYRKAEQHAPRGRTRMTKIDQLQRALSGSRDQTDEAGGP